MGGDQTLPSRIEQYEWSVREQGRGLWGTDPPKALADIVEALFGAVHIDGGFDAGQAAVNHALRSILTAVGSASGVELERYCCHPKRNILSELGCLVTVDQTTEEKLSVSSPHLPIWCGGDDEWQMPHANGARPVSILNCLGVPLLAVADSVTTSGVNRVCSFVLAFLFDNKSMLERFRTLKADVQRSMPSAAAGNGAVAGSGKATGDAGDPKLTAAGEVSTSDDKATVAAGDSKTVGEEDFGEKT